MKTLEGKRMRNVSRDVDGLNIALLRLQIAGAKAFFPEPQRGEVVQRCNERIAWMKQERDRKAKA